MQVVVINHLLLSPEEALQRHTCVKVVYVMKQSTVTFSSFSMAFFRRSSCMSIYSKNDIVLLPMRSFCLHMATSRPAVVDFGKPPLIDHLPSDCYGPTSQPLSKWCHKFCFTCTAISDWLIHRFGYWIAETCSLWR